MVSIRDCGSERAVSTVSCLYFYRSVPVVVVVDAESWLVEKQSNQSIYSTYTYCTGTVLVQYSYSGTEVPGDFWLPGDTQRGNSTT